MTIMDPHDNPGDRATITDEMIEWHRPMGPPTTRDTAEVWWCKYHREPHHGEPADWTDAHRDDMVPMVRAPDPVPAPDYTVHVWTIEPHVLHVEWTDEGDVPRIDLDAPPVIRDTVRAVADAFDAAVCPTCDAPIGWGLDEDDYGNPTGGFDPFWIVHDQGTGRAWPVCEDCSTPSCADAVAWPQA